MSLQQVDITRYGFSILQLETMSLCNMNCDFCGYPLRRDKASILPDKAVFSVIDSICVTEEFRHLCLSQFNEPLLDQRIYSFISYARGRKVPVMIVTNGLLFNSKEVIDRLIDARPEYIKVSLQVLSAGLFSRVRKTGYDFQQYKDGIFAFLKAVRNTTSNVTVDIACNFISGTGRLKQLLGLEQGDPSVYDTVKDLKIDSKGFLREMQAWIPSYRYDADLVDGYLADVSANYMLEPGLRVADNISLKIKPFIYGRRIEKFYPVKKARPCNSRILGVLSSGDVVPCCMAYDGKVSLGNIQKDTLGAILEKSAPLLDNIRNKGTPLPTACQHCLGAPTRRGAMLKKLRYFLKGQR
ncbi:MAG: radical SAM protein [Candidatus Omnitrophica bacterium]|nr:radical SAM protein [Candidatus Omnitrophota bacterium]